MDVFNSYETNCQKVMIFFTSHVQVRQGYFRQMMAIERQPRQRRLLVSNENHSHTKHHGPGRDKKLIWDHRIGRVHYEQGITCCRYFFILVILDAESRMPRTWGRRKQSKTV